MNLDNGTKREFRLSDVEVEFPTIHPKRLGKSFNFCYCATFMPLMPNSGALFHGIVKFDTSNPLNDGSLKEVGRITHGEKRYGGEAVFVPKKNSVKEDDGFLLTFVFDQNSQTSEFVVFDAQTMSSHPLIRVVLPQRIPYGFHGVWIEENQLQNQRELVV